MLRDPSDSYVYFYLEFTDGSVYELSHDDGIRKCEHPGKSNDISREFGRVINKSLVREVRKDADEDDILLLFWSGYSIYMHKTWDLEVGEVGNAMDLQTPEEYQEDRELFDGMDVVIPE